ncbi:TIGR04076 family protein [uncultured Muribaculum sp.]|uniref:TIGR04076 family protein n=1 Tax=uncultured Muribaculum sp. TaxID=1918613 RepID=UPI0025A9CB32|nr:TIGR04076 family protein [uncultured Muribaculum sp.]
MKKVKITVIRKDFNRELAKEYGVDMITPCTRMNVGNVFYAGASRPEGLCDGAWRSIHQYVFALANGAKQFWFNDWIRKPGTAISCCNDGLRPVFFLIEATDEEVSSPFKKQ